jgi:Fic family protein
MNFKSMIPNKKKAIFMARKQLDELVCDAVNLEGIPYSLPEVQTLLDGITVGGHKISDQEIVLNQAKAWKFLFSSVEEGTFSLKKEFVCYLHEIAGREEALEWGQFRSGGVSISGTEFLPPEPEELDGLWGKMVTEAEKIEDAYDKAIFFFENELEQVLFCCK